MNHISLGNTEMKKKKKKGNEAFSVDSRIEKIGNWTTYLTILFCYKVRPHLINWKINFLSNEDRTMGFA